MQEVILPQNERGTRLARLFRRSALGMRIRAASDLELENVLTSKSLFFSSVGNGAYEVECQIGSGDNHDAWMIFAFAPGEADSPFPAVLIDFNQDGTIDAMIEQMLLATDDPRHFKVVSTVPLYPHLDDPFVEVVAEKVADRIIDDLFIRGVPQNPERFQRPPDQSRTGRARS